MAKRIVELLKDLLIFLLIIAIVVLTLMALPTKTLTDSPVLATVLKPVARYFGISQAELAVRQEAASVSAAAQPLAISLKNPGGRCTYQYSFTALDNAYETLGGMLAQALGSCEKPDETDRDALYGALSEPSIAYLYPGALPCEVLSGWLGTKTAAEGFFAQTCVLCAEEDAVALYLVAEKIYRCETDCSADALRALCSAAPTDGSFFAFESDDETYAGIDGLSLLPETAPVLKKVTAQTPSDSRYLTSLASALGFNPYVGSSYQDRDGTTHYTESSASLTVTADGVLSLENSDPSRLGGYNTDAAARISAAAAVLKSMPGSSESEARLYLYDYTETETGAVCRFCCVIGGVAILPKDGLITVEFTNRHISALRTVLHAYREGTDALAVLPPRQAAAISSEGVVLRVFYAESGQNSLAAGWLKASD